MPENAATTPRAALAVFRLAALFTFLAVAMGAVVCATRSGAACPTWPGCRAGRVAPEWRMSPVIEFSHRAVAITAGVLVLAAALASIRVPGRDRYPRILPWVALVGALASGAFGRLVVLGSLPASLGAVDLCCALLAMTAMIVAAVRVAQPAAGAWSPPGAEVPATRIGRVAGSGVVVLVVMHVTGVLVAGTGSYTRCLGWPAWHLLAQDRHAWLQGLRVGLAGVGAASVIATAVMAARRARHRPWGVLLATLLFAEISLGLVVHQSGRDGGLAVPHSVLAVALLACLALVTGLASPAARRLPGTPLPIHS